MKYEYGVVYVTNGEKPDLPDDVLVQIYSEDASSGWGQREKVGYWNWKSPLITKFRIMDERYKPKPNDWHERGELPPVGTECEHFDQITKKWSTVWTVASHAFDDEAVLFCNESKTGTVFYGYKGEFRPLRTERDVLVDKAKSDFMKANVGGCTIYEERCIEALIDANWRPIKQQTEDEFAVYAMKNWLGILSAHEWLELYHAGCRFVVVGDE